MQPLFQSDVKRTVRHDGQVFAVEVQIGLVWVYVGKLLRIQGFGDKLRAGQIGERAGGGVVDAVNAFVFDGRNVCPAFAFDKSGQAALRIGLADAYAHRHNVRLVFMAVFRPRVSRRRLLHFVAVTFAL